jgi:flagellar basal body L-ring protein FlgH
MLLAGVIESMSAAMDMSIQLLSRYQMKKLIAVIIAAAFAGTALNAAAQAQKATPATPAATSATPAQPAKAKADNGKKKSKGKAKAKGKAESKS